MKHLMHILFLSCLKATELMEKKFYIKLTRLEKWQLKVHKIMCKSCSLYEKQSDLIEKGISQNMPSGISLEDLKKLKLNIRNKLEETN